MKALALLLAAVAFAGCSLLPGGDDEVPLVCGPGEEAEPCAEGVETGRPYAFNLLTHCGIEWAFFDGRYWVPDRPTQPPPDWAAIEDGTMTLESGERAIFRAEKGGDAEFVPAAEGFRPETCA